MQLNEMSPIRFLIQALPSRVDKKSAIITGTVATFILFGDVLFPLVGQGLYWAIEFIEQECEDLLESVFGLSTRESQLLIFWIGLPSLCLITWRLIQKPLATLKSWWVGFLNWVNGDWSNEDWFRILSLIAVLSTILYFIV